MTRRRPRRRWTAAEEATLEAHYGSRDVAQLARRLGRTVAAVKLKAHRLGLSGEGIEPRYSREELAAGLGVTEYRVRQWRERGWLRAEPSGRFRRREVRRFLAEHPGVVTLAKADPAWFLSVVIDTPPSKRSAETC